jgi:glycosyltransferase involved in cell wall biosynthesis|tara:strand:- start:954 stop:1847 length:894 start_codon:yes stop_codon:yes gene_type:complete
MRVCTFYETRLGRNDGPPLYWTNAMKNKGWEVVHLSSQHPPPDEHFDLYLWVDWGEDALTEMLPYTPINVHNLHPSVYVTSDTHLGFDYRLNKAREFDFVFCNQERAVEEFKEQGVESVWLPHAVEPQAYPNQPSCSKKYDVGFVGFVTFEKRARILHDIFKAFPNFYFGTALFEECAEIYRQSRVVINTAADDDINMRMFEATATGSFVLCENVPTLSKIFRNEEHIVTYCDTTEAIEKAQYYLKNEMEREFIAKQGMEHVLAHHTYSDRIEKVYDIVFGEGSEWQKLSQQELKQP